MPRRVAVLSIYIHNEPTRFIFMFIVYQYTPYVRTYVRNYVRAELSLPRILCACVYFRSPRTRLPLSPRQQCRQRRLPCWLYWQSQQHGTRTGILRIAPTPMLANRQPQHQRQQQPQSPSGFSPGSHRVLTGFPSVSSKKKRPYTVDEIGGRETSPLARPVGFPRLFPRGRTAAWGKCKP